VSALTAGEAHALISMLTEVPAEEIVSFVLVTVTEGPDDGCGHPENHRGQMVTATIDDGILVAGVLAAATSQAVRDVAAAKYEGGGGG
jgi:hypothetical protein